MIFISAGHHNNDPGAPGKNTTEAKETKIFRDLVCRELDLLGLKYIKDNDNETLQEYLARIKPGNASVVLEFHFNAFNKIASGTEVLIENEADRLDRAFAKELAEAGSKIIGIQNRGVKTEAESHRGRLGLMREEGIIALVEICFIDNESDMQKYRANIVPLAKEYARIIKKYEDIIK